MAVSRIGFLSAASREERRALLAGTLGWMLDGMDVMLFSMVIAALMRELRLSTAQAGLLASLTLVASAAGGVLFGFFADGFGRRAALMASMVTYSVFTAACGLSRSLGALMVFRLMVGLGMGGEWATGASLVAETWRAEHRGKALGVVQSGFAVGYALAAAIAAFVLPRWGWRPVFFAGILPALVTLWIRWGVQESPLWLARVARSSSPKAAPASFSAARSFYLKALLVTLVMNSAALFAWWGLFTWVPAYLALPRSQGGHALAISTSSLWIIVMQGGMWLGYVAFGFLSDPLGRKKTYVAYLLLAAALVPVYAGAKSPTTLLLAGPLVAFFGTGHFTGFGIMTAELFPTSFRASAMGLAYNFGRAVSAAAPWAIGALARRHGLGAAFWISGLAYLLAALLALTLPETRNRPLD